MLLSGSPVMKLKIVKAKAEYLIWIIEMLALGLITSVTFDPQYGLRILPPNYNAARFDACTSE